MFIQQTHKITYILIILTLIIYLVDPASSHMLVLKIKPCMPKYRWIKQPKLRMAH